MGTMRSWCAAPLVLIVVLTQATAQGRVQLQTLLTEPDAANMQSQPAVSGNLAVWVNNNGGFIQDVYSRQISPLGPVSNLSRSPIEDPEQAFAPDIDGNYVVWTHTSRREDGDIVLYVLGLGTASTIASSLFSSDHYEQPAIGGNFIAYVRVTTPPQRIVQLYDISNSQLRVVTNPADTTDKARPRVFGDYIVYEDYQSGSANVVAYRISTLGPSFPITTGPAMHVTPDIEGDTVVYGEYTDSMMRQIVAYNVATQSRTIISSPTPSIKLTPRISGNLVVWADNRTGIFKIFAYDLGSGIEFQLNPRPDEGQQTAPDVDRVLGAGATTDSPHYNVVYTIDGRQISWVTVGSLTDLPME